VASILPSIDCAAQIKRVAEIANYAMFVQRVFKNVSSGHIYSAQENLASTFGVTAADCRQRTYFE
jgi:hypothetical protein